MQYLLLFLHILLLFSKSGSSSSGQSIRTNFTGYTTNFDSIYNNNDPQQGTSSKRSSISTQPRSINGQFARVHSTKRDIPEIKPTAPSSSVPYLSHDHQYQKPMPPNYNGYSPQRTMHTHYQQNYNYQQGYGNNQLMNSQPQQGYTSPISNAYHSPQHTGMQSPHGINSPVPAGFQSPTYSNQVGYHSPGHPMMSPQQAYTGRQDYHYSSQTERQQVYAPQNQQPAVFQSPPHQPQYQNSQYYQRPNQVTSMTNQAYNQHNYSSVHSQYSNANMFSNSNNQNYNVMQNSYRQPSKPVDNPQVGYSNSNNQTFQIYQSPQQNINGNSMHSNNMPEESATAVHPMQEPQVNQQVKPHDNSTADRNVINKNNSQSKNAATLKSPTSALRTVRHDQPNVKFGQNSPDIGFSNQYLNFISNRNEPKDNANTPKFTNSPNISHKMHKNLYVSSPEQAQMPPSSGMSDSDSKDGMPTQTVTPIQTAKLTPTVEKQKDISKRQLDFEHNRLEFQSEDSRDSVSKESRISAVYSRQSMQSDGYGMDVDSENSMECGTFKSTHSISLMETSDIPRPADIDFPTLIDPFNRKLLESLLEYVKFPNKTHAEGYNEVKSVPKLQLSTVIGVGNNKFSIEKQLGKGNYGAVFLCLDLHSNKSVAVKYQKPSRPWEFYICQEIKARIKDPFMV